MASVPSSIKSIFVTIPIVLSPFGSSSLANCRASEFARSLLAAVSARINEFEGVAYFTTSVLIYFSMSAGCPVTGILVIPGKSTSVRSTTVGEYIVKLMAS